MVQPLRTPLYSPHEEHTHTTQPYQQTLAELQANKKNENKPRTKIGYIKPAED